MAGLLAMPAVATVYLAWNQGGFFSETPALVAIVALQLLVLRVLLSDHPFEGFGWRAAVATGALALFAAWQLISAAWSDSLGRALVEYDRTLLYLATFVLFASIGRTGSRAGLMIRLLALAFVTICIAGFVSRALPDVLTVVTDYGAGRLNYPVTYWNALGLIAALALVLLFHLTCSAGEHVAVRIAAAALVPPVVATMVLTYSRGAILAVAIGLVVYAVAGRPRLLLTGALAVMPFAAITAAVALDAEKLLSGDYITEGVGQGHHLARVVVACAIASAVLRALLLVLDRRLERTSLAPLRRLGVPRWAAAVVAVVLVGIAAVAVDAPGRIAHQYDRFVSDADPAPGSARLIDAAGGGRIDQWNIALDAWRDQPVRGNGAGTYQVALYERRTGTGMVTDGHSLYLETLAEFGVVGLALLLVALGSIVLAYLRLARGRHRARYAALFAATIAWLVPAGIDWHWEMPVTTLWVFAAGGLAVANARPRPDHAPARGVNRAILAVALLVMAVAPFLVMMSGSAIRDASAGFQRGDCARGSQRALESLDYLSARPEGYAIVGFCDLLEDFPSRAVPAMQKAVDRDPQSWDYRLGLAVALAADGRDPSASMREALRLNPREPLVRDAAKRLLGAKSERARQAAARRVFEDIFYSYKLHVQNL